MELTEKIELPTIKKKKKSKAEIGFVITIYNLTFVIINTLCYNEENPSFMEVSYEENRNYYTPTDTADND